MKSTRDYLESVRAAAHTPIQVHFDTTINGRDNFGEGLERCVHAVQLAGAMVGHDDTRTPMLHRQCRVLCGDDTLQQHREVGDGRQPLDIAPLKAVVHVLAHKLSQPRLALALFHAWRNRKHVSPDDALA